MGDLFKQVGGEKSDLVEEYKTKLTTYDFATITIKDYPIDIACDVFSRINTGGKPLTLFEIMVAMTYDEEKGFDLALKYEELLNGSDENDKSLAKAKFDTVPAATVLQAVATIAVGSIRAKDILKIRRENSLPIGSLWCLPCLRQWISLEPSCMSLFHSFFLTLLYWCRLHTSSTRTKQTANRNSSKTPETVFLLGWFELAIQRINRNQDC